MKFQFDFIKTLSATTYVLNRNGHSLDFLNLIKILYWSDKKALIEWGRTITGDRMMAMPQGPALMEINRLLHGDSRHSMQNTWSQHVSELHAKKGDHPGKRRWIHLLQKPEMDMLSDAEKKMLDEGLKMFGRMPYATLIKTVHNKEYFPEWHKPRGASLPIDPVKILSAACKSPDQIRKIEKDLAHHSFVDQFLGR